MLDKPWRNEELRRSEEALPRLKEGDLEKTSRMYKAKTGVGCDGFLTKVLLEEKLWNSWRRWSRVGSSKLVRKCCS